MCMVAQAANAEQALVEFRNYRTDITLKDLRLPCTNGRDAPMPFEKSFRALHIVQTRNDKNSRSNVMHLTKRCYGSSIGSLGTVNDHAMDSN